MEQNNNKNNKILNDETRNVIDDKLKKVKIDLEKIKTSNSVKTNITFETASKELDIILAKLEKGNLSLDETIKLYEQGARFLKICNHEFKVASGKITIIKNEIEKIFNCEK